METIRELFFDWNQTLLNDGALWDTARRAVFDHFGAMAPDIETYFRDLAKARGDYLAVYHAHGAQATREELNAIYERVYAAGIPSVRLAPHALSSIREAQVRFGVRSSIITTQTPDLFFKTFLLFPELRALIGDIRCGVIHKSPEIQKLCAARGISPSVVAYIGDSPSDIAAAKSAGAIAIRYRTGSMPEALFADAKPDFTIDDFRSILQIIAG